MILTFVHDGPLFYDEDGRYYEFAYHELLERYLYLADEITFMMRTKPISGDRKFTPVPERVGVVSVPNFKSLKTYFTQKKSAKVIVEKQIKKSDIVVLRTQSSIAQLALKYIHKYDKPYIIESVGCSWDSYWNHGMLGKAVAPYMFMKTRSAIQNADYVYYVTTEFLQRRYPTHGKTVCCSNVVVDKVGDEVLLQRLEKIRTMQTNQKLIVGTAAAIDTRYKGHEYVIRAIPGLVKAGYDIEYHLAGGIAGSKPSTFLRDLAVKCGVADRVVFKGSLHKDEMADYYDGLDIYIQPSKQEGLPRAVIEAMSRGCPCIGTKVAGIPELLQKECLFEKGRVSEVERAIRNVLNMDLERIATENFEKAKQYEKSKLILKREQFYKIFMEDNQLVKGEGL